MGSWDERSRLGENCRSAETRRRRRHGNFRVDCYLGNCDVQSRKVAQGNDARFRSSVGEVCSSCPFVRTPAAPSTLLERTPEFRLSLLGQTTQSDSLQRSDCIDAPLQLRLQSSALDRRDRDRPTPPIEGDSRLRQCRHRERLSRHPDGDLIARDLGGMVSYETRSSERIGKRQPHAWIRLPSASNSMAAGVRSQHSDRLGTSSRPHSSSVKVDCR